MSKSYYFATESTVFELQRQGNSDFFTRAEEFNFVSEIVFQKALWHKEAFVSKILNDEFLWETWLCS